MKKFTYLATMLLVMAGAVSCKKNAEVKEPEKEAQPTGIMRPVTISAGQATERTSVSGGTLTWSDGDKLSIVPTTGSFEAATLDIISGVGTASGTFQGNIDSGIADDTPLYGWTGGIWTYNSGTFAIDMQVEQAYVENGLAENAYPSIGKGTISSGISLSNPFGVLCLNVKGETTDEVIEIELTSAANSLAGEFTVDPSTTPASVTSTEYGINIRILTCTDEVALATDGKKFYMVVPAASYADKDLTVKVLKSDETSFEVTLGATTVTANTVTTVDVEDGPARPACQSALDDASNWVTIGTQKWLKVNTRCIEYDTNSEAYNATWLENNTIKASSSPQPIYPSYYTPTRAIDPVEYGYYYNWAAAVGIEDGSNVPTEYDGEGRQGICPNGSHIPSAEEWQTLNDYIMNKYDEGVTGSEGYHVKTTSGWSNEGNGDNVTEFAAWPAGYAPGNNVTNSTKETDFWASDMPSTPPTYSNVKILRSDGKYFSKGSGERYMAISVRCVKD